MTRPDAPSPLDFFGHLRWIDGRPLPAVIEPYRARILEDVLWSFDADGRPKFNLALLGRAKKNWKTTDLVLAAFYKFFIWPSPAGNDGFILANDEGQADDDLSLAKKLIEANPALANEVEVFKKEIRRTDGRGSLEILPAKNVAGQHGKTYLFVGFDEIHAYRNHDLFEALAPDPTRPDALTWVTSYASLYNNVGAPLHDMVKKGQAGDDPRMLFSWYSGDLCTDPAFADLDTPEARANPSVSTWEDDGYLAQQRRRLPSNKFRRLHLNLPGAPDGAFLDAAKVQGCIVEGRRQLPPCEGVSYVGFVDMSGGSNDDATLAISHRGEEDRAILDFVDCQAGRPPFDPRAAVRKFAGILKEYGCARVVGDAYAGETFRRDFEAEGIIYRKSPLTKSAIYEAFEPVVNAGDVELLDHATLEAQLLTLVQRGARVDHQSGDHDDFSNAAAGAVYLAAAPVEVRRTLALRM